MDISGLGVTIDAGGATIDTNGKNVAFASSIGNGGSGGLTVIDSSGGGSGTLIVSAAIDYTGGTAIVGATMQAGPSSCLGNSATITLDGGTLEATGGLDLSAPIVLNPGGGTIDTNGNVVELDGQVSGPGGLTAIDSSDGRGELIITAANDFTGGTVLQAGTVELGNEMALGSGSLIVNGGVLNLNCQSNIAIVSLSGSGGLIKNSNAADPSMLTVSQSTDQPGNGGLSGAVGHARVGGRRPGDRAGLGSQRQWRVAQPPSTRPCSASSRASSSISPSIART